MNNKNNNNFKKQTGNEQGKAPQKPKPALREVREGGNPENQNENSRNLQSRDSNPRQKHGRDGYHRHGGYFNRQQGKMKPIETIDDIKADIARIEKEIKLEIKEIKSLRLGL